jgi:hypothetical protein
VSRPLDPDEKMSDVAAQLRCAEMGITRIIKCPYCGGATDFTPTPERDAVQGASVVFCCEKLAFALVAAGADHETAEMVDFAQRLEDKSAVQAVFN